MDDWSDDEITRRLHAAIGEEVELTVKHRGAWTGCRTATGTAASSWSATPPTSCRPGAGSTATPASPTRTTSPGGWRAWSGARTAPSCSTATRRNAAVARRNAEQAQLRSDYELRFGIRTDANREVFDWLRDGGELLMRYRYGRDDTVEALHAQTGARFPHAWIEKDGRRLSTLDLFGDGVVAVGGPAATGGEVLRAGEDFRFADDGTTWSSLTNASDAAVIHVRPDGFVAAR